jgi:hypothetical protein
MTLTAQRQAGRLTIPNPAQPAGRKEPTRGGRSRDPNRDDHSFRLARELAFFAANTACKFGDWASAVSLFCEPQLYA